MAAGDFWQGWIVKLRFRVLPSEPRARSCTDMHPTVISPSFQQLRRLCEMRDKNRRVFDYHSVDRRETPLQRSPIPHRNHVCSTSRLQLPSSARVRVKHFKHLPYFPIRKKRVHNTRGFFTPQQIAIRLITNHFTTTVSDYKKSRAN